MNPSQQTFDVAIVGGGIVGLANAWMASRMGHSTVLFERNHHASGASIRNFGMVWPVGQPAGELFELAQTSRRFWLQLQAEAGCWVNPCGSIHLARQADEVAVLEEFLSQDHSVPELEMLTAEEVLQRSPAANPHGLLGGMWSPLELCVNPPQAIRQLTHWLSETQRVVVRSGETVTQIDSGQLSTAAGLQVSAERIVVCSGSDFETLFPECFRSAELMKCKLQMLATPVQPDQWRLGPHLAGGLTLRHYQSFAGCPSLPSLKARIRQEKPELDRYGIHVMASQNDVGQVILGDSHVYDEEITPFDSNEIDQLILDELQAMIRLPVFQVERRWHGIYAKHRSQHVFEEEPLPGCRVMTATGGAGMTLSFGLAERLWDRW